MQFLPARGLRFLANGFGFGVGSGVAINAWNRLVDLEVVPLWTGQFVFELDDVQNANFAFRELPAFTGGAGCVGFSLAKPRCVHVTPPLLLVLKIRI
jgi:hypothetical protein